MNYELRVLLVGLQPLDSAMRLSTHGAQEKRRKAPSEELCIMNYALCITSVFLQSYTFFLLYANYGKIVLLFWRFQEKDVPLHCS